MTRRRLGLLALAAACVAAGPALGQAVPLPPPRPAPIALPALTPDLPLESPVYAARPRAPVEPARSKPGLGGGAIEMGEPPLRPGALASEPTRLPSPFLHEKLVAPRTDPPVAIGVGKRATVGVFGDVGPVDPKSDAPLRVLNRDVGAGVTFQYRFGGD